MMRRPIVCSYTNEETKNILEDNFMIFFLRSEHYLSSYGLWELTCHVWCWFIHGGL